MQARRNLRTICGVLLVILIATPSLAAAPAPEASGGELWTAVVAWWSGLVDQLGSGEPSGEASSSEAGGEANGDGGPDIDPGG